MAVVRGMRLKPTPGAIPRLQFSYIIPHTLPPKVNGGCKIEKMLPNESRDEFHSRVGESRRLSSDLTWTEGKVNVR